MCLIRFYVYMNISRSQGKDEGCIMQYAVFLLTKWVLASSHCIKHSHQTWPIYINRKELNTMQKWPINFTSLKPGWDKHRAVNNGNTLNTKVVIWGAPSTHSVNTQCSTEKGFYTQLLQKTQHGHYSYNADYEEQHSLLSTLSKAGLPCTTCID